MRVLPDERRELIEALVSEADIGDVTAGLLEKDEHLTAALKAVFQLRFEHATLVFCGGTSLSKAHSLIERMSEDADVKIVLSAAAESWSNKQLRRYLGDEVRGQVVRALNAIGLVEDETARRSLNENIYLHSQWTYQRTYDGIAALRPNLQLELTARSPFLPIETALLGTLADKAIHNAMAAFPALVAFDVSEFGYQDAAFQADPKATLVDTLHRLSTDQQSRDEYRQVLLPLIYGKARFSYDEALGSFKATAHELINALQA